MRNLDRFLARKKRQEIYCADDHPFRKFIFQQGVKNVYENFNLSIFIDDYCNADCSFCVAQLRYENKGQIYIKDKIINNEEYFKRLEDILIKIRPLNPSVSITGGEPTKSKRLVPILQLLEKYDFRKRTITTNGSGLFDTYDGTLVIEHLINYHISHINISRAHYNEEINQKIMKYKDFEHEYTSNEVICRASNYLKNAAQEKKSDVPHIRMSCLLLKSGISNTDDIKQYLDFYKQIGIDNFIFRELMDYDVNTMVNKEKMNFCLDNKIYLNDVWRDIDKEKDFEFELNILGYYYYVEIYQYKGVTVASESANLMQLENEKQKYMNNVYEMVFHPNGNLNGSWVDNEDILDEY